MQKKAAVCTADPYYSRDTFRYSIYRIWSVWYAVLCNCTALGHVSSSAGACTMVIMVLPLIMRTAEEALKSVPDSYREASFGLGAGKLRTIFTIVLPSAVPGILAGIILAIGRVVGETAALLYTSGTVAQFRTSDGFRTYPGTSHVCAFQ